MKIYNDRRSRRMNKKLKLGEFNRSYSKLFFSTINSFEDNFEHSDHVHLFDCITLDRTFYKHNKINLHFIGIEITMVHRNDDITFCFVYDDPYRENIHRINSLLCSYVKRVIQQNFPEKSVCYKHDELGNFLEIEDSL